MRDYGPRHIFMAIGISLLLFSPILWLIAPILVTETIYYERDSWLTYVYPKSLQLYGVAIALVVIAPVLLWLVDVKKWTIGLASALIVISGVCFYGAGLGYFQLREETVAYRLPFEKELKTYDWAEVAEVIYHIRPAESEEPSWYTFTFTDGSQTEINETRIVTQAQGKLNSRVRTLGIPLIYDEL
ncbi:hypothetical protein ACFO0S_02880 [Chryseomicrobium palamuruense]|uniref:Uncharacterized protein n=1 Tax=Chryseomicrobium palamuruense TaxID=682973 RepID=A0ABV8UT89_9BACL